MDEPKSMIQKGTVFRRHDPWVWCNNGWLIEWFQRNFCYCSEDLNLVWHDAKEGNAKMYIISWHDFGMAFYLCYVWIAPTRQSNKELIAAQHRGDDPHGKNCELKTPVFWTKSPLPTHRHRKFIFGYFSSFYSVTLVLVTELNTRTLFSYFSGFMHSIT